MPGLVVMGSQWGDEGKGKAIDALSGDVDYGVRYSGGNNAGHTVVVDGQRHALHLLPSSVLHDSVIPVLGNGVVIDLGVLFREIDLLASKSGRDLRGELILSPNAHIVTDYHVEADKNIEEALGHERLGTTGRGIGPAYADKASRLGVRVQDLLDSQTLLPKLERALLAKRALLGTADGARVEARVRQVAEDLLAYSDAIRPMVRDVPRLLTAELIAGKTVLFESAQAHHLDVDHGTYPYVTSSNPTAGNASVGTGVAPTRIDRVIGVAKSYTTRVGQGPMPTELTGAEEERLRKIGDEYGVTTGRPRRCGWFDAVLVEHAALINGFTELYVTKLDTLSAWSEVPLCVAYEVDGRRFDKMPLTVEEFTRAKPIYEVFEGWHQPIGHCRSVSDLPATLRRYLSRIQELCNVRIQSIGTGPSREQVISGDF